MNIDIKCGVLKMIQEIKYILLGTGIIQVWQNDQLLYSGTDWKAAQLSVVPF